MKTQYYTATSLDGFIADPDHSLEWLLQLGSVEETSYPEFIRGVGALAMGSHTYEWLLRHQTDAETGEQQPWPYQQPVWVFSTRSLPGLANADVRFVRGDIRPVHSEMASITGGKNLWIVGGGELAGQFHDHGLLDEMIIQIAPVTLGAGMPLFPRRIDMPPLRLLSSRVYGETFVEVRYQIPREGEPVGRPS